MEQCDQGKSAKQKRNFGRSFGSKGWISEADQSLMDHGFGVVVILPLRRREHIDSKAVPDKVVGFLLVLRTANLELALRRGIQLFN